MTRGISRVDCPPLAPRSSGGLFVSCVSLVKRTEMPGFIKPQLATLRSKAPSGDKWIHEIKYDGYRVQLHLDRGKAKAFTRNGLNWIKRFSLIASAFDVPGQAIIDGEVVVVHGGRTNFSELQAELARGDQDRLLYYAFDLLWLDCQDLRKRPQIERTAMLRGLFDSYRLEPPVLCSEHLVGDGQQLFEHARKLNYEGIISKRRKRYSRHHLPPRRKSEC